MLFIRRRLQRPVVAQPDFAILRHVEKLLVSEHEAAVVEFVRFRGLPSSAERANAAREKAVAAMRRLGAFLKTREIPADLMATISGHPRADAEGVSRMRRNFAYDRLPVIHQFALLAHRRYAIATTA